MPHLPTVSIRKLGAQDVELFRRLLAAFADGFDDAHQYLGRSPGDTYLADLLGQPQFIALAALDGTTVTGGLAAYELKKFEQERSEIYIYDLAVTAPYRRKGIATALIGDLKAIAMSRGAYVIFVQADLADAPAIALYTKLGSREDVLHFDILPG